MALGAVNQTSGTNNYTVLVQSRKTGAQTPDPFDFTDQFDVPKNTPVISETVTPTGLSGTAPVFVSEGSHSASCIP